MAILLAMGSVGLSYMWVVALLFCAAGVFFAFSASMLSVSLRKGKQRLKAYVCIGGAICIAAVATVLYQSKLPTFEALGSIESAQIHSEGKGHRTNLRLRVASGAELVLNASGSSPYFHSGQQVHVRYQAYSGSILKAHFIDGAGKEEGVFNGTDTWQPYWWLLWGLLVIGAGVKQRARDPEGAKRV